jgi:Skp family chaperone for outer membrane proteins
MRQKTNQSGLLQWAILFSVVLLTMGFMRSNNVVVDAAPVNAPVIASVRISELINGLDELKDREAELRLFIDERQAEIKKIGDELQSTVDELNMLPAAAAQRKALVQKALRLRLNLEVEGEISSQLIDQRRGEVYADIFKKIEETAQLLAQRAGYHLIITDDSDVEIRPNTEQNVRAGILTRRVLFSDPSLDITDDLMLTMNNAWKAGN